MNSLYGRFGMSIQTIKQLIIDEDDLPDYKNKGIVREHFQINSIKSYIEFEDPNTIEPMFYNSSPAKANGSKTSGKGTNISISCFALAAAITAYARIYMSTFIADESNQNLGVGIVLGSSKCQK